MGCRIDLKLDMEPIGVKYYRSMSKSPNLVIPAKSAFFSFFVKNCQFCKKLQNSHTLGSCSASAPRKTYLYWVSNCTA